MIMYSKEIKVRGTNNGYEYFIDYEHPLAVGNSGLVYLHRHLASIKVNRWLSSAEHVHHIDENKLNNSFENLVIYSNSEHRAIHAHLNSVKCLECDKEFMPRQSTIKYCSVECKYSAQIKSKELTKDLLDTLIPKYSWVALGKMFGYSDNGIKKRAKSLGCNTTKPR